MNQSAMARGLAVVLPPLALIIVALGAWELYVSISGINPVTLPAPSRVLEAGFKQRDILADHAVVTLQESIIGLAVSVVLGTALAIMIDLSTPLRRAIYPLLVGSQTIPVVVIAPLLVLWFGFDLTPKIIVVTLYTFFPITVSLAAGFASTDRESMLLMQTLGAGKLDTLRLLRMPQALPAFFTGLRLAVTYSVIGAVFAEWAGAREGLGIYMLLMKNSFRTDLVLAALLVVTALSISLFLLTRLAERIIVKWR